MIKTDPVEPGAKAASASERREPSQHFDQDFLRRVFRVLRMEEHADGDVVDPSLMTLDQLFERLAITRSGARHKALIFGVGCRAVGQGAMDAHRSPPAGAGSPPLLLRSFASMP